MITVYTKDYCPFCIKAKQLLTSLGVEFTEVDVTRDADTLQNIMKVSGMRTVPQIFVDEDCLGGYSDIEVLHQRGELLARLGKE